MTILRVLLSGLLVMGLSVPVSVLVPLQAAAQSQAERLQSGDEVRLREDRPDTYVVVKGDTLWDISATFLENPFLWPQIWQVNPQIENPDLIYPGDIVALRYIDGFPALVLERGGRVGPDDLPVIELEPRIRHEPLSGGLRQLALERINSLLNANRIVDEEELEDAAYILGTREGNLLSGINDVIYARGDWIEGVSSYDIVRRKQVYTLPETGEEIGVELATVAEARIIALEDDVATLRIIHSNQEVRLSDKLLPRMEEVIPASLSTSTPSFAVDGAVLGFEEGKTMAGPAETLVMGVGADHGLEFGNLLDLQRQPRELYDEKRKEALTIEGEIFGQVLVYRVFEQASMGLIIDSNGLVKIGDRVTSK